jgi:plasmid stabilization system protein ParE
MLADLPYIGTRGGTRRRLLLPRSGYFLYYRVRLDGQFVDVLAVWHSKRGRKPR